MVWLGRLLLGFVLAAGAAELLLRAMPVSTGYPLMAVNAADPIARGAPYAAYVYSRDWNFRLQNSGRLNNYGFRASYDYKPDPGALIVVGNSFINAEAINPTEDMTERVGRLLGRRAYAIGVDGFHLADYLVAARWAGATFWSGYAGETHSLLVLLTTGDLDNSCRPRYGEHYLQLADGDIALRLVPRAGPTRLRRWLNRSMLFRYILDNLHVRANWHRQWQDDDDAIGPAAGAARGCATEDFSAAASRFLLKSFREFESADHARVVFVLAPGYRADQGYAPGATRDIDLFAQHAATAGFDVLHMEGPFLAAVRAGERLDFLPVDGHWNANANAIAAQAVAHSLMAGSMATAVRERH